MQCIDASQKDIKTEGIRRRQRPQRKPKSFNATAVNLFGACKRCLQCEKRFIDHGKVKPVNDESGRIRNSHRLLAAFHEKIDYNTVGFIGGLNASHDLN